MCLVCNMIFGRPVRLFAMEELEAPVGIVVDEKGEAEFVWLNLHAPEGRAMWIVFDPVYSYRSTKPVLAQEWMR